MKIARLVMLCCIFAYWE